MPTRVTLFDEDYVVVRRSRDRPIALADRRDYAHPSLIHIPLPHIFNIFHICQATSSPAFTATAQQSSCTAAAAAMIACSKPGLHAIDEDLQVASQAQATDGAAAQHRCRCPHRAAALSQGVLTPEGLLQCAYHGWAFDGIGACRDIPQLPAGSSPPPAPLAVQLPE